MKSFKAFLNEQSIMGPAVDLIINNCQPFLKESNFTIKNGQIENGLWRGMSKGKYFFEVTPRMDREPKDTSPTLHRILDNYFLDVFGTKFRSDGVFCSNLQRNEFEYGNTSYLIFPKGEFKYAYSYIINDAYICLDGQRHTEIPELFNKILTDMKKDAKNFLLPSSTGSVIKNINYKEWYQLVEEWLYKTYPYSDGNLKNILSLKDDPHEIMVKCDSYYALAIHTLQGLSDPEEKFKQDFLKELESKL